LVLYARLSWLLVSFRARVKYIILLLLLRSLIYPFRSTTI